MTVVSLFTYSYLRSSYDFLPIGWDTARYVAQLSDMASKGPIQVIRENSYYNFGYTLIESLFTSAGVPPTSAEIVFPIVLCVILVTLPGLFSSKHVGDDTLTSVTILLTASWFTLYRLGTDLHSNLLALVLILAALTVFPAWSDDSLNPRRKLMFYITIFAASFTHVETTLFFVAILSITLLAINFGSLKSLFTVAVNKVLPLFFAVLTASVFYIFHTLSMIQYGRGNVTYSIQSPLGIWASYLGIFLPLSLYGLYIAIKTIHGGERPQGLRLAYLKFISTWAILSLIIAAVQYVIPPFSIFSERALILFPTPFLAGLAVWQLLKRRGASEPRSQKPLKTTTILVIASVCVLGIISTYSIVSYDQRVWIPKAAYEKLNWVKVNYPGEKLVFVFNDLDQYAGGIGNLYDNWAQAVYGDHYTYLGRFDFLLAKLETPFENAASRTFSYIFFNEMAEDGLFLGDELLSRRIILIDDLYLPRQNPHYYRLREISEGVFLVNATKIREQAVVYIELYPNIHEKVGHWYGMEKSWTQSHYALETWDETPTQTVSFTTLIPVPRSSTYAFSLRYWDGLSNNMHIELNGTLLTTIFNGDSERPVTYTEYVYLNQGILEVKVSIDHDPEVPQYALFDCITLVEEREP